VSANGSTRVGVYVDVSNIAYNGGYGMHYDVLREFACRNHGIAYRLNVYVAYDEEKAKHDPDYRRKTLNFHMVLRDFGYKVIVKKVMRYRDEEQSDIIYTKANADIDMAVDALIQSERLDYVLLVTGDGDFVQVVRALQSKGCRVEVLAFENVSKALRDEADVFTSGYLVPNLLPALYPDIDSVNYAWGEAGSRVRGVCYAFNQEKGFGFFRYLKDITGSMWVMDSRRDDSAYESIFVHRSQVPDDVDLFTLPNRDQIFEFKIIDHEKGRQGQFVQPIYHY
jgi:uncharacterized LabA/DUF88 family protein